MFFDKFNGNGDSAKLSCKNGSIYGESLDKGKYTGKYGTPHLRSGSCLINVKLYKFSVFVLYFIEILQNYHS